ncbi:MAG: hypothetical protein O3B84_00900 [Chloroflexi bacterium]|nr:hypothetical protein [Chloroflexota bacterium]
MPNSKYVRVSDVGELLVWGPDALEVRMAGMQRMHFYRLAGVTPEDATDEQVEHYFALRSQEVSSGERATKVLKTESATDMVTRELRIFNLPQVMGRDEADLSADPPASSFPLPSTMQRPPMSRQWDEVQPAIPSGWPPPDSNLGVPESDKSWSSADGMPPAPRYRPQEAAKNLSASSRPMGGVGPVAADSPMSRFVRQDGPLLYLQAPDGTEQRVTQYMRTHFLRMIERDIVQASDEEIEMWWKLQGSLDPGTTLQEARSMNLLTEALQAAGKLRRTDLEVLHQSVTAWLEARAENG